MKIEYIHKVELIRFFEGTVCYYFGASTV